jgi:putative hydrolase of the HAD superfamily
VIQPGEVVVFDLFGVIARELSDAGRAAFAEAVPVPAETFWDAYWSERPGYDVGTHTATSYWHAVYARLNLPVPPPLPALLAADVLLTSELDPEMVDLVTSLCDAGHSVALLSNIPASLAARLEAHAPWLDGLAGAFFSGRLGLAKPDPAIFEHVCSTLGVTAGRLTLLDDRQANVDAAVRAGWRGIRFTDRQAALQELGLDGI